MEKQINHVEYKKISAMPNSTLSYIIEDCKKTLAAWPDHPRKQYYQDEIFYCSEEIKKRKEMDNARLLVILTSEIARLTKKVNNRVNKSNLIDDVNSCINRHIKIANGGL